MNCRRFHAQQVVDNDDQPKKKPIEYLNHNISFIDKWARKKRWKIGKKQVLKTAYQENPKVFDMEPVELHSDADGEEDAMFSDHSVQTKLSKVLTFNAGKIPMASHTISGSARRPTTTHQDTEAQKADGTSDDSGDDNDDLASTGYSPLKAGTDHTDDEDNDAIAELLPATRRTK
ncbi:uncharacterized protein HD556DRAFT_1443909 [Suillus plorans]|uniref:Uncharacterized protein n=1 Tax=Suillus plorans TaxID=116603 RepID=A0A9P7DGE5_9AGAM|nr:uncharacterized protein HD556DRAFT_1443909 [Suillus plorans]KAG1793159.1 hypothetical protein HD556DRAFT_1443909 [Suillus plorans]